MSVNRELVEYGQSEQSKVRRLTLEYLEYGEIPAVVLVPKDKKLRLLQESDIVDRYRVRNKLRIRSLWFESALSRTSTSSA